MDVETLGSNLEDVLCDLQLVEREAADLGLQLYRTKYELVCEDPVTRDFMLRAAPGHQVVDMNHTEILGSPIGSKRSVYEVINEKIRLLGIMGERLCHSLAIPKILHVFRSSPFFVSPNLEDFDDLLRRMLSDIINVCLESSSAWLQASLPVSTGGIGIGSTAQLALSAYLAFAAGYAEL